MQQPVSQPTSEPPLHYDVVILGAGLAGLTLARHLGVTSDKRVLVLERRAEVPPREQKYGEATVQLSAYYFGKVLEMEEHLIHQQLTKYNLRFHWKTAGKSNDALEHYSQAYIRKLSNIHTYQLDRNSLEAALLRKLEACPRHQIKKPVTDIDVDLVPAGPHRVAFTGSDGTRREVTAGWVVDATGRGRLLAKRMGLTRKNGIRHGAYFMWIDGNLDIEQLTDLTARERRLSPDRRTLGHTPFQLATNHFCGEGLWFWVIPLHDDKTSLGLVFDRERVRAQDVTSPEKLTEWVCREFPLFARDLPQRKVLYATGLLDFSHGCARTISEERWAMSGEAGRFLDPLYSPGSDFIAIHNTLIVDAILGDAERLPDRCRRAEQLMRALYEGFVPSFTESYDLLGDAEAYAMKYTWELAVYFGFYVFPFLNDLLTEPRFFAAYVKRFSRLGQLNRDLQQYLLAYYRWKKEHCEPASERFFFDFMSVGGLMNAEKTFYEIGVTPEEAREVLEGQLSSLQEMARFFVAHVASQVLGEPAVLRHRAFVEAIDLGAVRFDPAAMAATWERVRGVEGEMAWGFDATVMELFRPAARRRAGALGPGADEKAGRDAMAEAWEEVAPHVGALA
jgi:flavin-dependent dehydrogenase